MLSAVGCCDLDMDNPCKVCQSWSLDQWIRHQRLLFNAGSKSMKEGKPHWTYAFLFLHEWLDSQHSVPQVALLCMHCQGRSNREYRTREDLEAGSFTLTERGSDYENGDSRDLDGLTQMDPDSLLNPYSRKSLLEHLGLLVCNGRTLVGTHIQGMLGLVPLLLSRDGACSFLHWLQAYPGQDRQTEIEPNALASTVVSMVKATLEQIRLT